MKENGTSCKTGQQLVQQGVLCFNATADTGNPGQAVQHRKLLQAKRYLHWLILFLHPFYFRAITLTEQLVLVRVYKRNQVLLIFLTEELLKAVRIFAH